MPGKDRGRTIVWGIAEMTMLISTLLSLPTKQEVHAQVPLSTQYLSCAAGSWSIQEFQWHSSPLATPCSSNLHVPEICKLKWEEEGSLTSCNAKPTKLKEGKQKGCTSIIKHRHLWSILIRKSRGAKSRFSNTKPASVIWSLCDKECVLHWQTSLV